MEQPRNWLLRSPGAKWLSDRFGGVLPIVTFTAGFVWDTLTLTRIDRITDNLILLGYLLLLAIMIVLALRARLIKTLWMQRFLPHLPLAMQFLLGALLSSYVVFYFKSASWTRTASFLILLVILLIGNEFLRDRLGNRMLIGVLYFFSLFSFLVFFLPVVLKRVDDMLFLISGAISLVLTLALFYIALPGDPVPRWVRLRALTILVLSTYVVMHLLYFGGLIPPVPLALKSSGIYHSVTRTGSGYEVTYVSPPWYRFWKKGDDPFYMAPGDNVYFFTAVFAPQSIDVPVLHCWSRYSAQSGWTTTDCAGFDVTGGREGGYRGFTVKKNMTPGSWRVDVTTERGRVLGRAVFKVVSVPTRPDLVHSIIK